MCSWHSVDVLDNFASLECVRLSHNPFCENDSASRHEIVARAGKLLSLNASEITEKERRESEIRYLRNVVAEISSSSGTRLEDMELDAKISSDEVLAKHPRAKVLKEMHGERALAGVQTTKTTQSQQQLESRESDNGTKNEGVSSSISLALTLTREGRCCMWQMDTCCRPMLSEASKSADTLCTLNHREEIYVLYRHNCQR